MTFRSSGTLLSLLFAVTFCSTSLFAQPDIGVTSIQHPLVPFCPGSNNVDVVFHNFGTDTVFSATIQWSVNGIGQAPLFFNGTILPGANRLVTVGTFLFGRKTSYTIFAATQDPNGVPDVNPSNDSVSASNLLPMMTGNFSAGIISDYPTIGDAVNDLIARGVCGPVTININPGIYTEQIIIGTIPGATASNTITFQSSTADNTSVILTWPSSSSSLSNYTLKLDGAAHVVFSLLSIGRSGTQPYAHGVVLDRKAAGNVFSEMRFLGAQNVTDDSLASLVYSDANPGSVDSLNAFVNSVFIDGAAGIYLNAPDRNTPERGNSIEGNRFMNQYAIGVRLADQSFVSVRNNTFITNSIFAGYVALQCTECLGKSVISGNKIEGTPGKGIVLSGCAGDSSANVLVANNFIHSKDSVGIVLDGNVFLDVVFNSIHVSSPAVANTAMLVAGNTATNRILNNICMNSGGGYACVISDSSYSGIVTMDRNDLFTTGNFLGNFDNQDRADLFAWIAATGLDSNSVSADPEFIGADDLHATSYRVDNAGIHFAGVANDIDGEVRSPMTPDIGADEFTTLVHDLSVSEVVSPANGQCEDSLFAVQVVLINTGNFAETGFMIHANISGAISANLSEAYAGTLQAAATDTLTFAQPINTLGGGNFSTTAWVSSPFDIFPANDTIVNTATILTTASPAISSGTETCGPDTVVLVGIGNSTLYWYDALTGGTLLDSGSVFHPFVSADDTFYVQNGNVCPAARIVDPVMVHPLPAVNLGNDTVVTFPQTVSLSADSGYVSYAWSTGDTTASITVTLSGMYSIAVTDSNGCTGSDSVLVTILTAVTDVETDCDVILYPNPASGKVTVLIKHAKTREGEVFFRDIAGRILYKGLLSFSQGFLKGEINLLDYAGGIYVVQVVTEDGNYSKRVIVNQKNP